MLGSRDAIVKLYTTALPHNVNAEAARKYSPLKIHWQPEASTTHAIVVRSHHQEFPDCLLHR